jgi:hypothetical protein
MPVVDIVLVHGIAQEQRSAADLETDWLPSLVGGLENAGHVTLADRLRREADTRPGAVTVRMAFYGDRFRTPDQQGITAEDLNADEEDIAEELAVDILENAVHSSNPRDAGEAQRAIGALQRDLADEQGPRRAARQTAARTVAALDRIPWFTRGGLGALALANRTLAQVTRYLANPEIRSHAIHQVSKHLTPHTQVVIGHSLGSVVAYETLRNRPADPPLPLLVTLGSPLGLSAINRRLSNPLGYPDGLVRWVNIAADDDVVAARPNLLRVFDRDRPNTARFDPTWRVDNGSAPHRANFYLTTRSCGQALADTL